jgi:hypothetical protein
MRSSLGFFLFFCTLLVTKLAFSQCDSNAESRSKRELASEYVSTSAINETYSQSMAVWISTYSKAFNQQIDSSKNTTENKLYARVIVNVNLAAAFKEPEVRDSYFNSWIQAFETNFDKSELCQLILFNKSDTGKKLNSFLNNTAINIASRTGVNWQELAQKVWRESTGTLRNNGNWID